MLEKFLSKLGASTRITIGVTVSPNVGIEMVEIDKASGTVTKYGCKPLEYNSTTREITDYEEFRIAIETLLDELDIPKNSNIVLSLPNVHFGLITLPVLLTDDAITNAIISEVEQSYIFKRQEPLVSWTDIATSNASESRQLAYSAFQKQSIEQILSIFEEIGCHVTCIESSYASVFRALNYLEIATDQIKDGVSWNLMLVMPNNYSILSLSGKKVLEYYEEPLALKSFIDDEIYNAIKTSAQLTLAGLPANYLLILSETDLVSAEVLSLKMPFEGTVKFLDCNKFAQKEIMPVSLDVLPNLAYKITPQAIGVGLYTSVESPLKLNIMQGQNEDLPTSDSASECPKINIGNLEVELTPKFAKKLCLILAIVLITPLVTCLMLLNNVFIPKKQAEAAALDSSITTLNNDIKAIQEASKGPSFDVYEVINNVVGKNKTKLIYYSALGVSIPPKLWVNYYATDTEGKVFIKGSSNSVKSIYTFYKNMKQIVNESDIKLRKLEVSSNSIDDMIQNGSSAGRTYEFEITNMSDSAIAPTPSEATAPQNGAPPAPQGSTPDPNQPQAQQNQNSFMNFDPSKPFFGQSIDATQKAAEQGAPQAPAPPPTPSEQSNNAPGALPNNLKKIEKF